LAYTNSTAPSAAQWTRQRVFKSDDPYASLSGRHLDMQIDSTGAIHAICYNDNYNDLIYLYAPNPASTGGAYSFNYAVAVDTEGASGEGGDLSLDESGSTVNPYVSYHYVNKLGTVNGLKFAYKISGSSNWEYEIVPLSSPIDGSRTSIEYARGGTWGKLAIAYLSDRYELVYLQDE